MLCRTLMSRAFRAMHMQMKPAQRYVLDIIMQRNTLSYTARRQNILSTQRRVLTTMVYPNFWIGTLKDSEHSEFCPGIWLKRQNFSGR